MKITIQKTANVPDPVRAHNTDAGLDLYIPEGQGCLVRPGAVYTIDLGVRVAITDGYYGQLTLRSAAGKKGLAIPNGVGIIDSGYRGNVKLLAVALAEPVLVAAGERICQLVIMPLPAVEVEIGVVDDDTDRGTGGFGSTGVGDMVGASATPRSSAGSPLDGSWGSCRRPFSGTATATPWW
jgi:dUTP pyrophosphatase